MAVKAIIFDCFGVLYTDGKSRIVELCPPENRQALDDVFLQADYGFISSDEFSEAAADLLGISRADLAAATEGLYRRNEPLIQKVREYRQQYKIGLLSNVNESFVDDLFSSEEQAALFDTVVLSSKVGMVKPSTDIYLLTAERLGVEPSECIMTDDLEKNVAGAESAGMKGVLFTSTGELDARIRELLDA